MSYLICDFMGDEHLTNTAEALVNKNTNEFRYLISHSVPNGIFKLSNLEHLDANYLYSTSGLYLLNKNLSPLIVEIETNIKYLECMQSFLICFDRIDPLGMSTKEKMNYFWNLLAFYDDYFETRSDISSIVFCNVPHMPWDILLFYYAKYNNIKTIFLRKTGIGGYLYIDEDFRTHKSKINHSYSDVITLNDHNAIKCITIGHLLEMNFTKGQIGGSWNLGESKYKKIVKYIAKLLRLSNFLTTLRIIRDGRPVTPNRATEETKQVSIFAAYRNFSWYDYLSIHFRYISKVKKLEYYYNSITKNDIPNKKFVYISLHLQPERSTNPEGGHFDDQSLMIKIISQAVPPDWCIVVKEHPKQFKYDLRTLHARSINFYKSIERLDNVIFIKSNFEQELLIQKSEITATVSGSVGWESLLQKKPALIFSQNWHTFCEASQYVYDLKTTKEAIKKYINMSPEEVEDSLLSFIHYIAPFLIYGALNKNHVRFFIEPENKDITINNIANAIMERIEN